MHSLPLVGLILLGLIFLWLNYSEYIVVEGARNIYNKSVSIASEIQQIQGNLKNNNKKIKEFQERLDGIGDMTSRVSKLEKKTKDF
jgi:DNA anti-recombination protein RmuC